MSTIIDIPFNDDQLEAIRQTVEWFKGWQDKKHQRQVFFLAGYAGTGKTSVARKITSMCADENRVVFIAPTGKAAARLRQKGCKNAKTMHQFIYNMRGETEDGEPIFVGKGSLEEKPLLIVLDEASMLGERDARVLQGHGIPILALGDTGQVEPVKQVAVFVEGREDFILTKIERNDGNIVRASMFVRQGKRLPLREYNDVRVRSGAIPLDELVSHVPDNCQIITAYNNSRMYINSRIRKALGYTDIEPQVGEKIVCTFNQHGHGFMNGEQGIVIAVEDVPDAEREDDDDIGKMVRVRSLTDNRERVLKYNPMSFDPDAEVRTEAQRGSGGFDFGYALTVHKSQGSEWDNVLFYEERFDRKLSYTANTRAIKQLTIYQK